MTALMCGEITVHGVDGAIILTIIATQGRWKHSLFLQAIRRSIIIRDIYQRMEKHQDLQADIGAERTVPLIRKEDGQIQLWQLQEARILIRQDSSIYTEAHHVGIMNGQEQ